MKFTINQKELAEALIVCGKVVKPDIIIPILQCYKIEIEKTRFRITGASIDIIIEKELARNAAKGEIDEAIICLPAERLKGLVTCLSDQLLEFLFEEKFIRIVAKEGKYLIPFEDAKSFPAMKIEEPQYFHADIAEAIEKIKFATLNNSASPFCGVFAELKENELSLTCCNGTVLSSVKVESMSTIETSFLMRLSTANILNSGTARIGITTNNISFEYEDGTTIKAILLDMKYPDWRKIVPVNDKVLNLNRLSLVSSLNRVTQFANERTTTIVLNIKDKSLSVQAANDLQEAATEELETDYTGDEMIIGINGDYLNTCVSKLESDVLNIEFSTPKTAIVINEEKHTILLMPYGL